MAAGIEFTEADLRQAAGPKSFERGLGYVREVEDLEISDAQASAFVHGTSKYRVLLTFGGDGGLGGDCTCPHNLEGFFCKHCVAVGLAVLALGDDVEQYVEAAKKARRALDSWLESLSKEDLLAELTELLAEDPDLRRRFEWRAASANADVIAVRGAVRELIALSRRDYVDYGDAHDYARDVCQAAQAIGGLIDAEAADDAIELAREAQRPVTLVARSWEPWAWADGPVLVDALLDDGDLDAAWAAAEGAATQAQWLRLADASIQVRPADALAVYTEAIESLRTMTGDQIYQQMARLLLSVRACHEALGSMGEFRNYLAYVRMDQKRKRNLMRILDLHGL